MACLLSLWYSFLLFLFYLGLLWRIMEATLIKGSFPNKYFISIDILILSSACNSTSDYTSVHTEFTLIQYTIYFFGTKNQITSFGYLLDMHLFSIAHML